MRLLSQGAGMRRREFFSFLGGAAAAWPLGALAQERVKRPRIGFLMHLAPGDPDAMARVAGFLQGLQEQGWATDRNIQIDYRWAVGQAELYRKHAAELVALQPDVLVTTVTDAVRALQQSTRTIPIVFTSVIDPVGSGLITSLSHPGGNATGFSLFEFGISGKWLELLKQIAPSVARVAVLRDSASTRGVGQFAAIQAAAATFGVELRPLDAQEGSEIDRAIGEFVGRANSGLIVTSSPTALIDREFDYQARSPASIACDLSVSPLRHRGRLGILRAGLDRSAPPRRELRRPHSQGREAVRPSGASTDQVRACHQLKDSQRAGNDAPSCFARRCRRGDRITMLFAALNEFACGANRAWITIVVIIASQATAVLSRSAHGQELAPAERTWLINSTKQSCERSQLGKLPKEVIPKYCDCYALSISNGMTRQELLLTRVSPELQRKMERASAACQPPSDLN